MHDPMTVAFNIKFPWYHTTKLRKSTYRYWEDFITVWHVDPERGGSDDSCGWCAPPLTNTDRKVLATLVAADAYEKTFSSASVWRQSVILNPEYRYFQLAAGNSLALVACAWLLVAKEKAHLTGRDHGGWRKLSQLSTREWWNVVQLSLYPPDNLRASLCDQDRPREEQVEKFLWCVLRAYNRFHRPWHRHPRWHVWHWHLQIHPLQTFKRWAFSRCCKCGKRFSWGYSPCSGQWDSDGPAWFRSEKSVFHSDCDRPRADSIARSSQAPRA
jgi:hypothetical protein